MTSPDCGLSRPGADSRSDRLLSALEVERGGTRVGGGRRAPLRCAARSRASATRRSRPRRRPAPPGRRRGTRTRTGRFCARRRTDQCRRAGAGRAGLDRLVSGSDDDHAAESPPCVGQVTHAAGQQVHHRIPVAGDLGQRTFPQNWPDVGVQDRAVVGLAGRADREPVYPPLTRLAEVLPPGLGVINKRHALGALVMGQLELRVGSQPSGTNPTPCPNQSATGSTAATS